MLEARRQFFPGHIRYSSRHCVYVDSRLQRPSDLCVHFPSADITLRLNI